MQLKRQKPKKRHWSLQRYKKHVLHIILIFKKVILKSRGEKQSVSSKDMKEFFALALEHWFKQVGPPEVICVYTHNKDKRKTFWDTKSDDELGELCRRMGVKIYKKKVFPKEGFIFEWAKTTETFKAALMQNVQTFFDTAERDRICPSNPMFSIPQTTTLRWEGQNSIVIEEDKEEENSIEEDISAENEENDEGEKGIEEDISVENEESDEGEKGIEEDISTGDEEGTSEQQTVTFFQAKRKR